MEKRVIMSKIIIVSELFYPDKTSTAHILTKIADHLAKKAEVLVISSEACYSPLAEQQSVEKKNYPIIKVKSGNYNKNSLISRSINLCRNSLRLISALLKHIGRDDEIITVTNPAPILLLTALVKRLKKIKLTILVHDVFPENAIPAGIIKNKNSYSFKCLRYLFDRAYSKADRLIVLGRDMKSVMENKIANAKSKPEISIIENWADANPQYDPNKQNTKDINILYAGNIGRCQGLEDFVALFASVKNSAIRFRIRGSGAISDEISNYVRDNNIDNICNGGPYRRDEQFAIMNDCDIALVTLCDGMYGLGVPSKSYNIMSAGKPILFVGDPMSEIALVIKEAKIGYVFANSDIEGLKSWLMNVNENIRGELIQMGERARELALTRFSEETILSKYSNLFNSI